MDRGFLEAYNRELALLYEGAKEFAEDYPGIAERLGGLTQDNLDPAVAGRLRAAQPVGQERPGLHLVRANEPAQCPLCRGSGTARCKVQLRDLRQLFAGLSAPSGQKQRNPRRDADDRA